ncbi:MAG: hypothetical protein PHV18_09150 [Lachnospiraceae bacterium]|nr:hypothetical protein [Lachnospiraceae bacterium]
MKLKDRREDNLRNKTVKNTNLGVVVFGILTSILFGFSFLLTPVFKENSNRTVEMWRFPIGVIWFLIVILCLYKIQKYFSEKRSVFEEEHKKLYIKLFLGIVLVGSFYLLVFYPGTGMYDTLFILTSEGTACMRQHPWFYVVLVQAVVRFVLKLGGGL